jgi:hypothetical protein
MYFGNLEFALAVLSIARISLTESKRSGGVFGVTRKSHQMNLSL